MTVTDNLGRTFKKLRISVTSSCNFNCNYCVPDGYSHKKTESLAPEKLAAIAAGIHQTTPLESVRITGGEPLLYSNLETIVSELKNAGIPQVNITSNGSLLKKKAAALKNAGLDSLNVSLDTMDESIFKRISKTGKFTDVLAGIEECIRIGLPVKLNCTVVRGLNDSQIIPLLEYASSRNINIRYIELMEMGHLKDHMPDAVFLTDDILAVINSKYKTIEMERNAHSTAEYWQLENGYQFGIISNISRPFCSDCDRLRLDSQGKLYGCLSINEGFNAADFAVQDRSAREFVLNRVLRQKQQLQFTGSELSMRSIGG